MTNVQNQNIQEETLTWGRNRKPSVVKTIMSDAERQEFNEVMMAWGNRSSFSQLMKDSGRFSDEDVQKVKQEEEDRYTLFLMDMEQKEQEKQAQWTY